MDEPFLSYLLAFVLPLAWLLRRSGLLSTPFSRWMTGLFLLGLVALRFPIGGVDVRFLHRIDLLLVAAVVAILAMKALGAPWTRDAARYTRALTLCALASVTVYTNFFSFHGGAWMHLHDVAHYYLGSKYAAELDYGDLYVGILRAEAEEYGNLLTPQARELRGSYLIPVERLLARSDAVKARFAPTRWQDFRTEVRMFRDSMGAPWAEVVKDHGYNPTPAWSVIGGFLANRVPAGSRHGIFLLTLLDPLLLGATFVAIALAFDADTSLLAIIYFCLTFGAGFAWTGGAFLRELSFSAIVVSAALAMSERQVAAGVLLGFAASLRVYPALLAAGPIFQILGALALGRAPSRVPLRFVGAFFMSAAVLFVLSAAQSDGLARWHTFATNIAGHGESASANVIGLTSWLAYARSVVSPALEPSALIASRGSLYLLQLATIFASAVVYVALRSQRDEDLVASIGLGALLVFTGLNLSAYYYSFLVVLVLIYRHLPEVLALLFGVELGVYAIQLFEAHEVVLYLYKSLLLLWFFLALHLTVVGVRLGSGEKSGSGAA